MAEQGGEAGGNSGGEATFTQADIDNAVKAALAGVKAEDDPAFKALWQESKDAKARAKAFEGLDADEARAALAKLKELETEGKAGEVGVTSEQLKAIRAEVEADLEGKYTPFKTENETLRGRLRELQLDSVVKSVMAKQGVRAERVDALFRLTADKFDLTDEGEPMLKDHPGRDIAKFVAEELGKEYPEFYQSSGSSGGGASRSNAGGSGTKKTVAASDKQALSANLEGIAKGDVVVDV